VIALRAEVISRTDKRKKNVLSKETCLNLHYNV